MKVIQGILVLWACLFGSQWGLGQDARSEAIALSQNVKWRLLDLQDRSEKLASETNTPSVSDILEQAADIAQNLRYDVNSKIIEPLEQGFALRQARRGLIVLSRDLESLKGKIGELKRGPEKVSQDLAAVVVAFEQLSDYLDEQCGGDKPSPDPGVEKWACVVADPFGNRYRATGEREGQAGNRAFDLCLEVAQRCSLLYCEVV
ncbi:hypothetical protein [Pseudobacteriovorax antillogorgiicola]|uniref:Uncharacterized protein n=1 Tax=Pseudobacteriovorax antillogorgiicola TaxID=1513793 RepID=A0A1Y6CU50_9BACT|nr:hypothetical protein [Pseudobacteriovorax antillogorgiicola]TCS44815.1 hypothetical protein EDD56_13144 [Pseudobacteriovorax antillogorgiicola]SMF77276.1 hypothetical protein SAMN06296036_13120 [Pseudobacteriovorax antillogorgiicola]